MQQTIEREDTKVPEAEITPIYWHQLYGNQKRKGACFAAMIRGEMVVKKRCKLDGEILAEPSEERSVIYDRDFVIKQIQTYYRFVLADCTLEEWLALCEEVYESR